jgi:uncharacterized membrane protein
MGDAGELTGESSERDKTRIRISSRLTPHSFADIIFGLALSIGALFLTQNRVQTSQDFAWNVVLFAFSFLVIAITWLFFSRTMSALSSEIPSTLFLNLVMLFCVALEPYLFYMLMNNATQNLLSFTSIGYALDVGFMFVILGTLAYSVLKQNKRLEREEHRSRLPTEALWSFRRMMIEEYVLGALFLVSASPTFWVQTPLGHLRFVIWYLSFLTPLVTYRYWSLKGHKMGTKD